MHGYKLHTYIINMTYPFPCSAPLHLNWEESIQTQRLHYDGNLPSPFLYFVNAETLLQR